ncbi:immunity 49 family protein [Motilimonas cestriensis]|uniref:immunity 49 family protein n=1 Tax=Motilimonas cestriensis TaxID=2742685 RepID=UPI003DA44DEF
MTLHPHHYIAIKAQLGQAITSETKKRDFNEKIQDWQVAYQTYTGTATGSWSIDFRGVQYLLGISQLLDAPQAMRQRALINLEQMAYNPICMVAHVGQPVTVTLEHRQFTGVAETDDTLMFNNWLNAFSLALILRNTEHMQVLHALDEGVFAKNTGILGPHDFDCAFMRLLKGLFTPGADLPCLFGDMITYSAPNYFYSEESANWAYHLYLPVVELLGVVLSSERETRYQDAYTKALEAHRAWFTRTDMDHFRPEGLISLPITAIASYCYHQYGLLPEFETDYTPLWMIKGEFMPESELPPLASYQF